jgi:hypothetical protein
LLGVGPLIAFAVIWIFFPETKGRELEEISGEVTVHLPTPLVP